MTVETKRPLFSVVTATYNALEGLKTTVESVASQTIASVEHIIVDGSSNDGTREYLESLGDKARWVSEPDEGIADAMNKGIAMAKGEWIIVLHAEDTLLDATVLERVSKQLSVEALLHAFDVWLTYSNSHRVLRKARPLGYLTHYKMTVPHQGLFVRRELYDRIGKFDSSFSIAMDYEFLLRAKRSGAIQATHNAPVSIMPATGISTKRDWESVRARLHQDRRLQSDYSLGTIDRFLHALFWALYLPFKRVRADIGL